MKFGQVEEELEASANGREMAQWVHLVLLHSADMRNGSAVEVSEVCTSYLE